MQSLAAFVQKKALGARDRVREIEGAHRLERRGGEPATEGIIGREAAERVSEGADVLGSHDEPVAVVLDDFLIAAPIGNDAGETRRESFEDRVGKALVERGEDEHVRAGHGVPYPFGGHATSEQHAISQAQLVKIIQPLK